MNQIQKALDGYFGPNAILNLEILTTTSTNPCFKASLCESTYFIKHLHRDMLEQDKRASLFDLQSQLAEHDIAPKPIAYLAKDKLWIEHWNSLTPACQSALNQEQLPELLAITQAKLHAIDIDCEKIDLKREWVRYLDMLPTTGELRSYETQQMEPILHSDTDLCFCHNDLQLEHIFLSESGSSVIDWEYAGVGHRSFDLCSTIKINNLTKEQQHHFLKCYATQAGMSFWVLAKRVEAMFPVLDFTYQLWHEGLSYNN